MVKKIVPLLLCSLLSFSAHAADLSKSDDLLKTDLRPDQDPALIDTLNELLARHEWIDKNCYHIQPNSFNALGKAILKEYIKVWVDAAQEAKMPTDRGLVQIFATMHEMGPDNLISNLPALLKANEYDAEYVKSPSKSLENITKKMVKTNDGNYYFPGAQETVTDRVRIIHKNEFYNMMYKRHEAPKMPENNLVWFYNDQTKESIVEVLTLNMNNEKLKSDAIRGITLLAAYYLQEDQNN